MIASILGGGPTSLVLDDEIKGMSTEDLEKLTCELDLFRRSHASYHRVRALFYLYDVFRYHLAGKMDANRSVSPWEGHRLAALGKWEESIEEFLKCRDPTALAASYRKLAFKELQQQVRIEVQSAPCNAFLFDSTLAQPRIILSTADVLLHERTPVRADLTHSAWSDIFFLAFDSPRQARVMNMSLDLSMEGGVPVPPVNTYVRLLEDEPVLRLSALDLNATVDVSSVAELFDFAADYLGLLKAAAIASGVFPPWLEMSQQENASLSAHLKHLTGRVNCGLEVVTRVTDIPKGSRLAVSTTLCASIISALMRASGQTAQVDGTLTEEERRIVCSRAILSEWLGGSGGGWQDSGGVWPGLKQIVGVERQSGSGGGELLPRHLSVVDGKSMEALIGKLRYDVCEPL